MNTTKQLNVGANRGNKRVWVEAGPLESHGWTTGTRYRFTITPTGARLDKDPAGKRGVAGGPGRPIIDLCNKKVTEWTQGADRVSLEFSDSFILISPLSVS